LRIETVLGYVLFDHEGLTLCIEGEKHGDAN